MPTQIRGLVAATLTPFNHDGTLQLQGVCAIVQHLINTDIRGLLVCGTTGEYPSLAHQERMGVLEAYVAATAGRLPVIAHIGHDSIDIACQLAEHAQSLSVDSILISAPRLFRPNSPQHLTDWCKRISDAASQTDVYYYHFPTQGDTHCPMHAFVPLAVSQIPRFRGLKFTDMNLFDLNLCLNVAPETCQVFYGRDESLLGAIATGVNAATGSTYNFAAPLYATMWDEFEQGNLEMARARMRTACKMVEILNRYGGAIPAGKAIMRMLGVDCGIARPPLPDLDDHARQQLHNELQQIGFFEHCGIKVGSN